MDEQDRQQQGEPEEWLAEGAEYLEEWESAKREGRHEDAEAAVLKLMAFAAEHAGDFKNPVDPYYEQADACEEVGDWAGAEAAYRQAIEVADSPAMAFHSRDKIVNLFLLLNRNADALVEARSNVSDAHLSGISMIDYMAQYTIAVCAMLAKEPEESVRAADEALAALPDDLPVELQKARALTVRARSRVDLGDLDGADADLHAAWEMMEPEISPEAFTDQQTAGGKEAWLAAWWSGQARLRAARDDREGVLQARWAALRHRTNLTQNAFSDGRGIQKGLADAIRALGEAQQAAGDLPAAVESFAEARAMYEDLGLPEPAD
jgi:tetratricopeptide (TPR) repeat protein